MKLTEDLKLGRDPAKSVAENAENALAALAKASARRGFEAMKLTALEVVSRMKVRLEGTSPKEDEAAEFAVKLFRGALLETLAKLEFPEPVVLTEVDVLKDGDDGGDKEAPESNAEAEAAR